MNKINILPNSGERLSFFKLFSEKKYTVEIPIIQRDYAQGRASKYAVRASFLDALKQYLVQGNPNRDLDFVYGSLIQVNDSFRFVPLDGQQRLTTLFLLHWYLAHIADQAEFLRTVLYKNGKSLFRYETRASSSEFCDALICNDVDMQCLLDIGSEKSLSKTIQNLGWFHLSWLNDPTIQSMLNMLDSIHAKFAGHTELFERLVDEEKPIITFLFLDLKEFNLSDDLYIKMNARGKPLTDFENFKAKFEQCIKSFQSDVSVYTLSFGGEIGQPVNAYQYFVHKVDTDWADMFWGYHNEALSENSFDDKLMNFIRLIIANYCLIETQNSETQTKRLGELFGSGGKLKALSFFKYEDLNCFSAELVDYLIKMMDLLYNKDLAGERIKIYLDDSEYYDEEDIFKKVIADNTSYPEKLRFFAFYSYLASGKDLAGLVDWSRVIYNLTENTIINSADIYLRALISIHALSQHDESILEVLKKNNDVAGFQPAQVLEERVKAHLMAKSDEWKRLIWAIEKHSFFKGQIGFALNFSGILDFYRKNKNCDWAFAEDAMYFSEFQNYTQKGGDLFHLIEGSSAEYDYLWERAVLSKGVYFTTGSDSRWKNLLSTRGTRNNVDRDHSWKRLLRISMTPNDQWEKRQSYVKAVFDDPNFDVNDIVDSLQRICDEALNDSELSVWEKNFIKYKVLFEYCQQGFIYKEGNNILLLGELYRNHYHSELNSKVFHIEYKQSDEQFLPFKSFKYYDVKGTSNYSCACLEFWTYKENQYLVTVAYDNKYLLDFNTSDYIECTAEELICILDKHGFEVYEEDWGSTYRNCCETSIEAFEVLTNLCSDLRELDSD
ncbi:GmrSD restriction endonuclease domain-containing protein [Acinetobacter venetianus]|uniref:GmrSD restriction endonuclease domain-containing protein n=1 Tax=Acinetobacter venetianus TaxID=52133 RepID=UPI0035BE71B0